VLPLVTTEYVALAHLGAAERERERVRENERD
jgi:hypothetical protein